jgi:mono/diheme cytochrome c family protein
MQHMQTRANLTRRQARLVREFLLASNDADLNPGRVRTGLVTAAEVTDEMVALGRRVYEGAGTCFACHGTRLEGGPIAPNLNDSQWKNGTGEYLSILGIVRNGVSGTAMAAYPGGISDSQAQQVAAYVWATAHDRESK